MAEEIARKVSLGRAVDSFVSIFSPEAGVRRMRARAVSEIIKRSYDAAGHGNRTKGWHTTSTSASSEIMRAHVTVRNRMRELVRNDGYARQGVRRIVNNVVGTGIRPNVTIKGNEGKKVKQAWVDWAEEKECDFEEKLNFYGLQRLFMRTITESGSAIVLKRRYKTESGIPIQIQILEPDYLDTHKMNTMLQNGGWIFGGIEYDKNGKRVAYWLYEQHPGDTFRLRTSLVSRRINSEDVMHCFHVERPGQVEGMPLGVSAMLKLRDFNDHEDAQLMKQKIAACFSVFITDTNDTMLAGGNAKSKQLEIAEKLEPGMIEILSPGQTVSFASPPKIEGYEPYTKTILRGVAAGFGLTYEQLTNDLSNVNFSSGRMGWIESGKWFAELQDDLIETHFCKTIWKWFAEGAVIGGRISNKKPTCTWTSPKREFIDPSKETAAMIGAMRGGLKSFPEMALEMGKDPEELMEEIKKWTDIARAYGLQLEFDPSFENKLVATDQRKFAG